MINRKPDTYASYEYESVQFDFLNYLHALAATEIMHTFIENVCLQQGSLVRHHMHYSFK